MSEAKPKIEVKKLADGTEVATLVKDPKTKGEEDKASAPGKGKGGKA